MQRCPRHVVRNIVLLRMQLHMPQRRLLPLPVNFVYTETLRDAQQRRPRNVNEAEVYALHTRCEYHVSFKRRRQNGNIMSVLRERRGPVPPVSGLATSARRALESRKQNLH